ncbi:MAG: dTDP-4-dehydrorhamnose 3,5-epimerase family protein [Candidatus Daviesbacteria bacterium]|nr:dTDP-4-dehydrorhamnose 3,5-epimerase family protein [Candidatus Daviesbacteria bacterium]
MEGKYIKHTSISGLLILERPIFSDERGFFRELFHKDELEEILGFKFDGIQMNHSHSLPGVLRGIHAEEWNKIIYPVCGEAFIAIADIRQDSPTFAKVETFIVNDGNRIGLFIPNGLANSLCVIGDRAVDYIYLVDAYYDGSDTRAIAWDDPDLNINWPIKNPVVSERDKNNLRLRDVFPEKFKDKL